MKPKENENKNNKKKFFFEFYMLTSDWQVCLLLVLVAGPVAGTLELALQQTPREQQLSPGCGSWLPRNGLKFGQSLSLQTSSGEVGEAQTGSDPDFHYGCEKARQRAEDLSLRVPGQHEFCITLSPIWSFRCGDLHRGPW